MGNIAADETLLAHEVEADALGNIYSTEDFELPETAWFVRVVSADGELTSDMMVPKRNLSCNLCHDASFRVVLAPEPDGGNGGE